MTTDNFTNHARRQTGGRGSPRWAHVAFFIFLVAAFLLLGGCVTGDEGQIAAGTAETSESADEGKSFTMMVIGGILAHALISKGNWPMLFLLFMLLSLAV